MNIPRAKNPIGVEIFFIPGMKTFGSDKSYPFHAPEFIGAAHVHG